LLVCLFEQGQILITIHVVVLKLSDGRDLKSGVKIHRTFITRSIEEIKTWIFSSWLVMRMLYQFFKNMCYIVRKSFIVIWMRATVSKLHGNSLTAFASAQILCKSTTAACKKLVESSCTFCDVKRAPVDQAGKNRRNCLNVC